MTGLNWNISYPPVTNAFSLASHSNNTNDGGHTNLVKIELTRFSDAAWSFRNHSSLPSEKRSRTRGAVCPYYPHQEKNLMVEIQVFSVLC